MSWKWKKVYKRLYDKGLTTIAALKLVKKKRLSDAERIEICGE